MPAPQPSDAVDSPLRITVEGRELLDRMFTLVCIFSPAGVLLEANQAAFDAAGLRPSEVLGKRYDQIDPLSHSPQVTAQVEDMLRRSVAGETVRAELCVRLARGRLAIMDCMSSPLRDQAGIVQIVGTGVEITERKLAEGALLRLNRELRMLTSCNQRLVRATDEKDLLQAICRIIVEVGGYRLAWVGFAEHDAHKRVRPAAHAGVDSGYLDLAQISWEDTALGRGPTGRAIREQAVQICHHLEEDPSFLPWIEAARVRGYASSIALPLVVGSERGALNIYSDRPRAFDEPEVALLSELAHDLAYGISALRAHAERERQQAQIARLTRVLRMQSAINAAVLRIQDRDELLQEACRIATRIGGYDRAVVSIVDADGRYARPRFRDGGGSDFPEPLELALSDDREPDTNLTSRALRTGEITVCSDLTQSEPPVALRQRLIELGYRSVVALPLIVEGRRFGALTLTSRDVNLVRDEDLMLLQDTAANLSFALRSQEQARTAEFLAFYDPLTGLAKRAVFCQRIDQFLCSRVGPGENPAIVAFDIHDLNSINDSFGRRFGDLLLREVAVRLKRHAAGEEHIGYLGGGTFVMSEPQLISAEETIASLLDSVVFGDPFVIEGRTIRLSCRSGVARYPADGSNAEALVHNAEAALMSAKATGEQYVHYKLEMRSQIAERLQLEHRLRTAIDEEQFELHYQPQLNIASGRIESLEALLRWNDPERGIVTPASFLSVLESSGMILKVGRWVLTRAVRDCCRWADLRLGPVRVAVNVSALQIRQSSFVPFVADLVRQLAERAGYGIDLEITETALLQDLESARRKLDELRSLGVRIALDDFGTGYSSLGLLSTLPVDLLKIDRSFVKGLPHESASETLVGSIISLASSFGLITVAEGVESTAQLDSLRALRCDQAQGYLHCAPVPAATIEKLLALGLAPP